MLKYRMSAASLNRWPTPGKKTDGAGLFWVRNINGSLTAKQRVKNKDIKIKPTGIWDMQVQHIHVAEKV